MKFSEMLKEYLQLREDEASRDDSWTPIAQRGQRRERMDELLDGMDQLVVTAGVKENKNG